MSSVRPLCTRTLCVVATLLSVAAAFSQPKNQQLAGVRFSLYPNVGKENPPSLKQAVKDAVVGLKDLGIQIQADDVSSCLVGPESTLLEALRLCFARASLTADNKPRGVSMVATFSSGRSPDLVDVELPSRTVKVDEGMEFVSKCYQQPPRIAAQVAVCPLGMLDYQGTIDKVVENAKASSCWMEGKGQFCNSFMLDGDGNDVFDVLQDSLVLSRAECEQVKLTVTMTANKSAWPEGDRSSLRQ